MGKVVGKPRRVISVVYKKLLEASTFSAEELSKIAEKTLQKNLKELWYDIYTPEQYERTYDVLNSIKSEVKVRPDGSVWAKVYFDDSTWSHRIQDNGWGEHVGFDGKDMDFHLVQLMESGQFNSGNTGSLNNSRAGNGAGFLEKTREDLAKIMKANLKKALEKKI